MCRAQVLFPQLKLAVYTHDYGEPIGYRAMGELIPRFMQHFMRHRGWDGDYIVAQFVHELTSTQRRVMDAVNRRRKKDGLTPMEPVHLLLGTGVEAIDPEVDLLHGDIDYVYVVYGDHYEIRQCKYRFWEEPRLSNSKLLKRLDYSGLPFRKRGKPRKTKVADPPTRNLEL